LVIREVRRWFDVDVDGVGEGREPGLWIVEWDMVDGLYWRAVGRIKGGKPF
jgi:hypothetical protein